MSEAQSAAIRSAAHEIMMMTESISRAAKGPRFTFHEYREEIEKILTKYFEVKPLCKKCKKPLEKHYRDPAFVPKGETFCIYEPTQVRKITSGDSIYTRDEFIARCKDGSFTDYDGHGLYATQDETTDNEVIPSQVVGGNFNKNYDYVVWFNR